MSSEDNKKLGEIPEDVTAEAVTEEENNSEAVKPEDGVEQVQDTDNSADETEQEQQTDNSAVETEQEQQTPREDTEEESGYNPIKAPEDINQEDFDADDGEYVAPQFMIDGKKTGDTNQEPEPDIEDEEFRKYYEKYYNRRSFSEVIWKDRKKGARALIILLLIILVGIASAAIYINAKLNTLRDVRPETQVTVDEQKIYDEEEYRMMNCINSAESLKDYLYQWANNGGEIMSSPNVINVLLLGLDSEDALENGGRSDVIMLLSLNKKTQKINISSIYRDTWLYMNVDGTDRYTKFNASYYYGGPEGVIKTFEENFKIKIDFYATVDFSSFTDIINALGGIKIEVEQYEAEYINRTTVHEIEYGPSVELDGWEALVYARIRHCDADSDVSRTRRQRKVISTLLNELKAADYSEMYKVLSSLFGYVKTNLTKSQIVSYMIQAIRYNWMDYEITQTVFDDGEVFGTGYVGDYSTVFMDMPAVAYRLQEAVFENSNIALDENRATVFDTVNADRPPMPEETTQEETTGGLAPTDETSAQLSGIDGAEEETTQSENNPTDINGMIISQ